MKNDSFNLESTSSGTSKSPLKIFNYKWAVLSFLVLFAAGCKKVTEEPGIISPCPIIVSTDPTDKAVDVVLNKLITATFNTTMNPSTINNLTFTIRQGASLISGTVAPTAVGTTFSFKPDVPLLPFTKYTGTITTGVTDKFRTAMVSDYVWTFTTIPQVTLSANLAAGGTVAGAGTFAQSSVVTVSATLKTGYTFTNWTDSGTTTIASTSPSYQFTMAGNRALVANFTLIPPAQFAVMISSSPVAGGATFGSGSYNTGTMVTVIESPNPGYTFVNWTEGATIVSTSSSYQFTITSNRTLVANFTAIPALQYAVILSANPSIGGTTTGAGAYTAGTSANINASPITGYSFVNWTEGATIISTSAAYTFPVNANRNLTANFLINAYTLNVAANNGIVTKTPNQATYNHGSLVVLTATPAAGYTFTSWSGDATGSINPLTVVMNSNKNITANFTPVVPSILGSISNFGAFGGNAGITNQGINTIINNGGIGTTAASSLVTGFHDGLTPTEKYTETPLNVGNATGGVYTAPPFPGTAVKAAIAAQALIDANAAYISISPAGKPGGTDPGAGELGGLTLPPGVYKSASGTFNISNGNLTLDAQGNANAQWIFQTAAGLTVGIAGPLGAKSVLLVNGAQAKNVFWYVGSAATINGAGGGVMTGTIIATAGVTFSTPGNVVQTVLNGRAISLVASVTMVNTTINAQ
ncbi:MAG: ice-binding family protein [Ferruginibacter sp.]